MVETNCRDVPKEAITYVLVPFFTPCAAPGQRLGER